MLKKYVTLSFLTLLNISFSVAIVAETLQEKNKERLDQLYQNYKDNKLNAITAQEDISLLQAHITALREEQKLLNGFLASYVKPGLYKAGGYSAGLVLGTLAGRFGENIVDFGLSESLGGMKTAAGAAWRGEYTQWKWGRGGYFSFPTPSEHVKTLNLQDRLMAAIFASSPLLIILAGMGMDRMFTWAYQHNQKRDERLKAIEENIKLDEAIIAQLSSLK